MSARAKARRRALDILFEAEQRDVSPLAAMRLRREATDITINEYTVTLIEGVMSELDRIDEILSSYSKGWTLERMPAVDRTALRIGSWELL
ncbi:MAG: transcription antitermination factor NusB, partial [Paeniglutamicibacter terrestris]